MKISPQLKDLILNGTSEQRRYACSKSFKLFKLYYFSDYFTYKPAQFHEDFDEDIQELAKGELNEVAWIAFRESAKTSIAKQGLIWLIAYKKKRYIGYVSYDKSNAEAALFDVVVELQTNLKLLNDFGHLYTEKREKEESKLKRVSSFITTNKIKVEAFSTQESTRGRVYMNHRPDFFILDDIETIKTRDSFPIRSKILKFIREMKAGMGNQWAILYLGNYISEIGVIAYVMDRVEKNPHGVVRNIPVMIRDPVSHEYEITWKDKYVMTDEEANKINKTIEDPMQHKISIESKKRDLDNFQEDMMNDPVAAGQPFFDRKKIDEDLATPERDKEDKAGFKLWASYKPGHRYAIGADTSKGIGLDSNASVLIDFSTIPAKQIGSYASDEIAPDSFAHELKRQGDMFGTCLLAPETNAESGGTCLNELKKIYPLDGIYRQVKAGEIKDKPLLKLGWDTNSATKPEAFYQFKKAYEDGLLEINDGSLLKEMRSYTQTDLSTMTQDDETTRHFDKLMAAVIAWAMRNYATVKESKTGSFVQPDYEPSSIQ